MWLPTTSNESALFCVVRSTLEFVYDIGSRFYCFWKGRKIWKRGQEWPKFKVTYSLERTTSASNALLQSFWQRHNQWKGQKLWLTFWQHLAWCEQVNNSNNDDDDNNVISRHLFCRSINIIISVHLRRHQSANLDRLYIAAGTVLCETFFVASQWVLGEVKHCSIKHY